ncbi:MAG TPA: histidine--tRNA ligase [Planctomycetota bacterium]|nr:histidine--tRNA ligase [Planctomycetota bacterium]
MADRPIIQPRVLSGFRDWLPQAAYLRETMMEKIQHVFRAHGFWPIETPVLEYAEILTGKGGEESDRILYQFKDHGDRDVAMRFDLTVPLARYIAQHVNEVGLPFRRYHIGRVYRGERPGKGRFREFTQCDCDILGPGGENSRAADVEILLTLANALAALQVGSITYKVNHRGIINGILRRLGVGEHTAHVLRSLDKFDKIGRDKVREELQFGSPNKPEKPDDPGETKTVFMSPQQADRILEILLTPAATDDSARFERFGEFLNDDEAGRTALADLRQVVEQCRAHFPQGISVRFDPLLARGLDYYTGVVFEAVLDAQPDQGSISGGGRYDNLTGAFSKRVIPGVGGSIGIDRLIDGVVEATLAKQQTAGAERVGPAAVLILQFDSQFLPQYFTLATELRRAGIGCEVYADKANLKAQLGYADTHGFKLALIAGENEIKAGTLNLRNLATREQVTVTPAELVAKVRSLLLPAQT